jgi:hypothetical protein
MPSGDGRTKKGSSDDREGFSTSAIETKILCFRRWAFGALTDLPKLSAESTDFGGNAHEMAEGYLLRGSMPDYTRPEGVALGKGLHLLPAPGTVLTEQAFAFALGGVVFDGYVDFVTRDFRLVGDHKFIGDNREYPDGDSYWRREKYHDLILDQSPFYALRPEQLHEKLQPNIYALACAIRARSAGTWCRWVWYPKRKDRRLAVATDCYISADSAQSFLLRNALPHCEQMADARKIIRQVHSAIRVAVINQTIPCDQSACAAFAKLCDYSEHCKR